MILTKRFEQPRQLQAAQFHGTGKTSSERWREEIRLVDYELFGICIF